MERIKEGRERKKGAGTVELVFSANFCKPVVGPYQK
jgi:hypothetical protein